MKRILSGIAVLLAVVALSAPAYAEGRGGKGKRGKGKRVGKLFAKFDANKDGSLTADEVPEKAWTRLSKADADGNGAVTRAEIRAACKKKRGKKKDSESES